jgi:hypothetical protein
MAIRAVVFDIGGVLEITPYMGWADRQEATDSLPSLRQASNNHSAV